MKDAEKIIMERIGPSFDGWVVGAADGVISPFKHENDVEKTVKFFGLDKLPKSRSAKSRRRVQPA
jgi:hypothetical protein